MCVVSTVADHYWYKWSSPPYYPWVTYLPSVPSPISPQELEEFGKLMERAREYDKKNNQPDCETGEKLQRLKDLAKELGVELVFPQEEEKG